MTDNFDPFIEVEQIITPKGPPGGREGEWWMYWREDHPNTPPVQLLGEAITYFTKRYGLEPNLAIVPMNWEDLFPQEDEKPRQRTFPQYPKVTIRLSRTMLNAHLWLTHTTNGTPQRDEGLAVEK